MKCPICNKTFEPKNKLRVASIRYCSKECNVRALATRPKKPFTKEHRTNMSLARIGKKLTESHRKSLSESHKWKRLTKEQRKKIGVANRGPKHWNWQGGKTPINNAIRSSEEYKAWRFEVFKRDGFMCIVCGARRNIEADHIKPFSDFPELRFDIANGRTLCRLHHLEIGANWGKSQGTRILKLNGRTGGLKTAERGSDYYRKIANIRWSKQRSSWTGSEA